MKRVLMIADDNNRWGPARLPESLAKAGVEVAVLSATANPISHSSFVARSYSMEKLQSWRKFGKVLGSVMADWKPDLILPCDELVVAMLHHLLKNPRIASRFLDKSQLSTLQRSIGKIEMLDAMLLKYNTRCLAETLDVPVPKSKRVRTLIEAECAASGIGFPVFLKASFSWAGQGVIRCDTLEQVKTAFSTLSRKSAWIKTVAKRVLGRNWYPENITIEVQQAVAGHSVMFSIVALEGKVLGGLFARRSECVAQNGPSTTVTIGDHTECRVNAEKMVSAMGASGFLAFDFMCCEKTEHMFLLECNPRPNQIFHLGQIVGSDLCQALVDGLNGHRQPALIPRGEAIIPLFPQAWMQNEKTALAQLRDLDVPKNDSKLLNFMLRRGEAEGHASHRLVDVLKGQGMVPANYTFV
jgi:Carbamoyl-phosphate synthase L chain, ATP binding domain